MGILHNTLKGHMHGIESVTFSSDNELVASGSCDKTIRLWRTMTGALMHVLKGHSDWVISVAFSPDGTIASGSLDGIVRLWDASTGETSRIIEGHFGCVEKVAFSPNGRLFAFSSPRAVNLWDRNLGQTIAEYVVDMDADYFSFDHKSRLLLGMRCSYAFEYVAENVKIATYSLDCTRQWILYEGERFFWLPIDCQPRTYDVYENYVALGSNSGRVTLLRFGPGLPGIVHG